MPWSRITDQEASYYGSSSVRSDVTQTLTLDLGGTKPTVNLGAAGDPLGQYYHSGVQAAKEGEIRAQINAIKTAINEAVQSTRLNHAQSVAELPKIHNEFQNTFQTLTNKASKHIDEIRKNTDKAVAAVVHIKAAPAAGVNAMISGALRHRERLDRIAGELPASSLRPSGPSLAGGLSGAREKAFGSETDADLLTIKQESLKLDAARKGGLSTAGSDHATEALRHADKFARSGGALSRQISRSLVNDSRSIRYNYTGDLDKVEVTTINEDGDLEKTKQSPEAQLPNNSITNLSIKFNISIQIQTSRMPFARNLVNERSDQDRLAGQYVLKVAEDALKAARELWYDSQFREAETALGVGKDLIDIATSWTPGIGLARDVYELVSGRDLITGNELSDLERVSAGVGVVTGGMGSKVLRGAKTLERVARLKEKLVNNLYKRIEGLTISAKKAGLNSEFMKRPIAKKIVDRHTPLGKRNKKPYNGIFLEPNKIPELTIEAWNKGVRRPDLDLNPITGELSLVKVYDFGKPIGYRVDTKETTSKLRVVVFPDTKQIKNSFPHTTEKWQ